jgi:hypothetical protein
MFFFSLYSYQSSSGRDYIAVQNNRPLISVSPHILLTNLLLELRGIRIHSPTTFHWSASWCQAICMGTPSKETNGEIVTSTTTHNTAAFSARSNRHGGGAGQPGRLMRPNKLIRCSSISWVISVFFPGRFRKCCIADQLNLLRRLVCHVAHAVVVWDCFDLVMNTMTGKWELGSWFNHFRQYRCFSLSLII